MSAAGRERTMALVRHYRSATLEVRSRRFGWGAKTYMMAIINETPDSFSGDGIAGDLAATVALAKRFEAEGADILDVGGESSRPGATPLSAPEEIARVVPAIAAIRAQTGLPISIDTYHARVAEAALEAGADMVNDIWGLREDPAMAALVARRGVPLVAMHNQRGRKFHDVAGNILAGFEATLKAARSAGIDPAQIILDPGFGFGWTPEQNLELLRRLPEFWTLELPLLVGVSRKSTLGLVLNAPVDDRFEGTAAGVALCIAGGADIVRVHEVGAMGRVARVADAIVRANWQTPAVTTVVLALGANLGDRLANLRSAVAMLQQAGLKVTARSEVWETAPVPAGQPAYLNAAVVAETGLAPLELLALAKRIERDLGRRPSRRWGPRPADVDILFYGDLVLENETLTIPHPRIAERPFVLAPLSDVWAGPLPVLGKTAAELLKVVGLDDAWRTGERL